MSIQEAIQHPMVPPAPGDSFIQSACLHSLESSKETFIDQAADNAACIHRSKAAERQLPVGKLGHELPRLMAQQLAQPGRVCVLPQVTSGLCAALLVWKLAKHLWSGGCSRRQSASCALWQDQQQL